MEKFTKMLPNMSSITDFQPEDSVKEEQRESKSAVEVENEIDDATNIFVAKTEVSTMQDVGVYVIPDYVKNVKDCDEKCMEIVEIVEGRRESESAEREVENNKIDDATKIFFTKPEVLPMQDIQVAAIADNGENAEDRDEKCMEIVEIIKGRSKSESAEREVQNNEIDDATKNLFTKTEVPLTQDIRVDVIPDHVENVEDRDDKCMEIVEIVQGRGESKFAEQEVQNNEIDDATKNLCTKTEVLLMQDIRVNVILDHVENVEDRDEKCMEIVEIVQGRGESKFAEQEEANESVDDVIDQLLAKTESSLMQDIQVVAISDHYENLENHDTKCLLEIIEIVDEERMEIESAELEEENNAIDDETNQLLPKTKISLMQDVQVVNIPDDDDNLKDHDKKCLMEIVEILDSSGSINDNPISIADCSIESLDPIAKDKVSAISNSLIPNQSNFQTIDNDEIQEIFSKPEPNSMKDVDGTFGSDKSFSSNVTISELIERNDLSNDVPAFGVFPVENDQSFSTESQNCGDNIDSKVRCYIQSQDQHIKDTLFPDRVRAHNLTVDRMLRGKVAINDSRDRRRVEKIYKESEIRRNRDDNSREQSGYGGKYPPRSPCYNARNERRKESSRTKSSIDHRISEKIVAGEENRTRKRKRSHEKENRGPEQSETDYERRLFDTKRPRLSTDNGDNFNMPNEFRRKTRGRDEREYQKSRDDRRFFDGRRARDDSRCSYDKRVNGNNDRGEKKEREDIRAFGEKISFSNKRSRSDERRDRMSNIEQTIPQANKRRRQKRPLARLLRVSKRISFSPEKTDDIKSDRQESPKLAEERNDQTNGFSAELPLPLSAATPIPAPNVDMICRTVDPRLVARRLQQEQPFGPHYIDFEDLNLTTNSPEDIDGSKHPQLEDFLSHIFQWNPRWLEDEELGNNDPPDIVDDSKLVKMPSRYRSFEHYYEIVEPVLELEMWQAILHDYKLGSKNLKLFSLDPLPSAESFLFENRKVNTLHLQIVVSQEDLQQKTHPSNGDLLLLNYVSRKRGRNGSVRLSLFAYVTGLQKNFINSSTRYNRKLLDTVKEPRTVITYRVMTKSLRPWEFPNFKINELQKISYIRANTRMVEAVQKLHTSPLIDMILHPKIEDYQLPSAENVAEYRLVTEHVLNPKQLETVIRVTEAAVRDVPKICLIQGPPGTGKSQVIVNLLMQILQGDHRSNGHKKVKILMCAPSNTAIDEIVLRLLEIQRSLGEENHFSLVRTGRTGTMHPEAKQVSLQERANLKANKGSLNFSDNTDESYLARAERREFARQHRDVEEQLLRNADIIASTLTSCYTRQMETAVGNMEDTNLVCIVDEASQCTEPESLIPLMLGVKTLILVGDTNQLPATVLSQKAKRLGLDQSLFSRIARVFKNSQNNPLLQLDMQYRMTVPVALFPNKYFYGGALKNAARMHKLPFHLYRVINLDSTQDRHKFSNSNEADFIANMIFTMITKASYRNANLPVSVGIIAPYKDQKRLLVQKIHSCIEHLELEDKEKIKFDVNTVDSYQGQERDVIIMSCVRSSGIGFLSDRRRLCVALTRAKHSLIICGNFQTFQQDRMWNALIADAKSRRVYVNLRYDADPEDIRPYIIR